MSLREISTNLTHRKATLKRCDARIRPPKVLSRITGLSSTLFVAFTSTLSVAWTVLMERVYYHIRDGEPTVPYTPSSEFVFNRLQPTFDKFRRVAGFIAKWDFDTFVKSTLGRKRRLYERAVGRLLSGWSWPDVVRWSRIRGFIKWEKLPVEKKRLVPRLVQPRSPEYNVLLGCYTKACEHRLYSDLAEVAGDDLPVVGKGMSSQELGEIIASKWGRYADPVCVGFDQSRFDQHISAAAMSYEHRYYQCYFHSSELDKLLKLQLKTSGVITCEDGFIKYTIDGGRSSGDMNTGCGNTIVQFAILHSYCENFHFSRLPSFLVNGDDSLIICERADLHLLDGLPDFCADLGFVLTVEPPVFILEQVSFCQMNPVWNGKQYVMMRSFPRCVEKDSFIATKVSPVDFPAYLASIGEAGVAINAGVPVLQEFYLWLQSHSSRRVEIEDGGLTYWSRGLTAKAMPITEEARVSFYNATGVLPEHQEALERAYKHMGHVLWSEGYEEGINPDAPLVPPGGGCEF